MPESFYYADANSQPVGPLSLDEIRRFIVAGVVPPDVMVCEASGEDWKPITEIAAPPRTAPPPRSAAVIAPPDPERTAHRLHLHLCHAVVAVILFYLVDTASRSAASANGGTDPNNTRAIFAALTGLWATAAELILVFHICRGFPIHLRFSTPAKAAWFLIIPGFNIYWVFRLLPGFAEATLRWDSEVASTAGQRKSAPSWLIPLAYISASLAAVSTVFGLLEVIGAIPMTESGQWVFAISHGLIFTLYITVVGVIRGILTPEQSVPKESLADFFWDLPKLVMIGVVIVGIIKEIINRN